MNILENIPRVMEEVDQNMTSSSLMRVLGLLSTTRETVRERLQSLSAQQIRGIISKLKGSSPLEKADLDSIRLWIVGDAEGYIEMENNFDDWIKEFKRLKKSLLSYENKDLTPKDLLKLHGTLEDAIRVCADISNFLEKGERIKRFEEATKDTASLDREILLHILQSKLQSPKL